MFKSRFVRCATVALAGLVVAALILFMSACGSSNNSSSTSSSTAAASGPNAATATSAADFGGMDALVAAAQKEGTLNVIALPPDWANYGLIISAFEAKYKIKINSAQPDGNSQDEVNAITQLKGTDRAPDVVDLGANVTLANTALFAPYKVAGWADIPADLKDPTGLWAADYTGYESIGYNATKLPAPTSVNDLLKPAYKGMVALNGNPTQASAGFNGVVMAALANGGSADNIKPGVDFFASLKKAGNLLPVDPTPATIAAGQTPVVIDWTYNNLAVTAEVKGKFDWKVVVPANDVVASYYDQAINKDAPHPAAARLWEEYLYSAEGSNFWLKGGAFPVLYDAMVKAGTVDSAAAAALPKVTGTPVTLTQDQLKTAQDYLLANWNKAVQ